MSQNKTNISHISRVNQLDAAALDIELFNILKKTLAGGFQILNSRLLTSLEPEINALIRILLWKFTVFENNATIGQKLLNLKYVDARSGEPLSKNKNVLLAGSEIIFSWLNERLLASGVSQYLPLEVQDKFLKITEWFRILLKALNILNFLTFLQQGKYRCIAERILRVRSGNASPQSIRQVEYDYMTREILWHGFADFITFILPLINLPRVKNTIRRLLWSKHVNPSDTTRRTIEDFLKCAYCGEPPIRPHDIDCQHIFCYICLASNVKADPVFACPVCQKQASGIESIKPATIIC